jgi:hypothetical protein
LGSLSDARLLLFDGPVAVGLVWAGGGKATDSVPDGRVFRFRFLLRVELPGLFDELVVVFVGGLPPSCPAVDDKATAVEEDEK